MSQKVGAFTNPTSSDSGSDSSNSNSIDSSETKVASNTNKNVENNGNDVNMNNMNNFASIIANSISKTVAESINAAFTQLNGTKRSNLDSTDNVVRFDDTSTIAFAKRKKIDTNSDVEVKKGVLKLDNAHCSDSAALIVPNSDENKNSSTNEKRSGGNFFMGNFKDPSLRRNFPNTNYYPNHRQRNNHLNNSSVSSNRYKNPRHYS